MEMLTINRKETIETPVSIQLPLYAKAKSPHNISEDWWAIYSSEWAKNIRVTVYKGGVSSISPGDISSLPSDYEAITEAEFFDAYDKAVACIQSKFQRVETI